MCEEAFNKNHTTCVDRLTLVFQYHTLSVVLIDISGITLINIKEYYMLNMYICLTNDVFVSGYQYK